MSSPFQTLEEFQQATDGPTGGAIYTFANAPALIGIAIVLSVLLLFWFIYASYTTKAEKSETSNPLHLSVLIVAGLVSLAGSLYPTNSNPAEVAARRDVKTTASSNHRHTPLTLLGLAGLATLPTHRRLKRPRRKPSRRSRYPRL